MKQVRFSNAMRAAALTGGLFLTASAFGQQVVVKGHVKDAINIPYNRIDLAVNRLRDKDALYYVCGDYNHRPKKYLKEFKLDNAAELEVGAEIKADVFAAGDHVDVTGTSKGHGFQGVVKRHGFGGVGQTTHGQHNRARKPGSIGACSYPAKVFKGMRMGGHMGNERVTTQNLRVLKVIPESNLLIIKGSVAGCKGSTVLIQK